MVKLFVNVGENYGYTDYSFAKNMLKVLNKSKKQVQVLWLKDEINYSVSINISTSLNFVEV